MKLVPQSVRLPVVVVGIATSGCLLSILLFVTLRDWERREQREVLASLVRERVTTLRVTLLRSMEVLHSLAALHAADEEISGKQFGKFVRGALRRQPELVALSWNPVVPHAMRAAAEDAAGFCFRELDPEGRLVMARPRPEYVPVRFIEPLDRNAAVLGYDLNSDPARKISVDQARDGGGAVATAPIRLAQDEPEAEPGGFLVLLPVYEASPMTAAERRQRLAGFAVAVFRLSNLVGETFRSLRARDIDVWVRDATSDRGSMPAPERQEVPGSGPGAADVSGLPWGGTAPLSAGAGRLERGLSGTLEAPAVDLEIAGRRLQVHSAAGPGFRASPGRHQSWIVLAGGLLLTGLGTAYQFGNGRRSREVTEANLALRTEVAVRQRAEEAAASASSAKSDFLASMSHEIRTPLNAILGYVQLLQRDSGLSPDHRDSLAAIGLSGHHLLGLINEILDLAKIEAGRSEIQPVDFDLEEMVRGLAATFHPLCAQKRLSFRVDVMAGARAGGGRASRVRGDEGKLRQILINLIGNAVKFTGAGGVTLGIRAEAAERWRFEVVDTGQGIRREEQEDIFKPFHQGAGNRHRGGTGLGLAIAQRQVHLLGGDLRVESERGRGSRFYFSVTLEPGGAEAVLPEWRPARLAPGSMVRALVVDDRRENREVIGRMLALAGCEVAYARDAAEAEVQVRDVRPDVIFLDLLLPDCSGVELARRLAKDPAGATARVIAHTASPLPGLRQEALAAGCVDVLTKPVRCEQLYASLVAHLGVAFESAEIPGGTEPPARLPAGLKVVLPEEIQRRLMVAAELHSTTTLKACLNPLRQHGPDACLLADEIRHLMRSYDMDGIQQLLARTLEASRPEPGIVAHAAGPR